MSYTNVPSSGYGQKSPKKNIEGPKSVTRPKQWNEEVEEAYRFQVAGYR